MRKAKMRQSDVEKADRKSKNEKDRMRERENVRQSDIEKADRKSEYEKDRM